MSYVDDALARHGVVDLSAVGEHPGRAARRRGLVIVQGRAAVAQTQPVGWLQHVHAAALVVPAPFAFLSEIALWAHGMVPEPAQLEVGVGVQGAEPGVAVGAPATGRRHDFPHRRTT